MKDKHKIWLYRYGLPPSKIKELEQKGIDKYFQSPESFINMVHYYKKHINRLHKSLVDFNELVRDATIEMARTYINIVALNTPPMMGKKPPSKRSPEGLKLHNRIIAYLPSEIKKTGKNRFYNQDIQALKDKKLFRIIVAKDKAKPTAKYFKKNNRQTKAEAVIHMRYLARASWGAAIDQVEGMRGTKIPPNITNVLSKNKLIKQKAIKNNRISIYTDRGFYGVKIENNSGIDEGGWFKIADRKAKEAARKI
jgi:hypothetical protein